MEHPVRERIEQPEKELSRARDSILSMQKSKSIQDFEKNWMDFLHHLERCWHKAENLYRKNPSWDGWAGKYRTLRENDPLLSYLSNARCADEHSIQEIVKQEPGGIGINSADGKGLFIKKMRQEKGLITIRTPNKLKITFYPGRIRLLPVVNLGKGYPVPTRHMEKAINPENAAEIAEMGVSFYSDLLSAAQAFFIKKKS